MNRAMWILLIALALAPLSTWLGTAAINWTARAVGCSPLPQLACFVAGCANVGSQCWR